MMTKRRAESSSLQEAHPQKKWRSVCETGRELHVTDVTTTLIKERRRKRPRCFEDEDEGVWTIPGLEDRLSSTADSAHGKTGGACVSGKFGTCEMPSKERASGAEPEERARTDLVTHPEEDEDELCAFNTFQFWRNPLPAVDLSLLDSPSTTELGEECSVKDATEEMET